MLATCADTALAAVTAGEAWAVLHGRGRELDDVRAELEQARREAKKPKKAEVQADVEPEIERVGETNVIVMEVPGVGGQELLDLSDRFKQRSAPAAIVLGSREDGTANLVVNFDDAVAAKLSAGDVVKAIAPIVGGGGGGRPTMARAGSWSSRCGNSAPGSSVATVPLSARALTSWSDRCGQWSALAAPSSAASATASSGSASCRSFTSLQRMV